MRRVARTAVAAAVALLVATAVSSAGPDHFEHGAPVESSPRFEAPAPGSYELPAIDYVAEHYLVGTNGKPEPLLHLSKGELAVVSFIYLSCGEACPLSTAMLHRLDGELARSPDLSSRVVLVTVSFDPRRDTPAKMRGLRAALAPRGRWRFLTAANEQALRPVLADFGQDAVRIADQANAPDSLRHVLKVFVVDASGAIRQIYSTDFLDPRLVLADLRTLLGAPAVAGGDDP
jgi:cytochrome oxidase Cu insertion factor (SCO1/SenC/PrrC family)